MDLRRELGIFRRSWKVIVLVGVLAAAVAFVASNAMARSYEAGSRLLVGQALQASNPDVNLFQSATDLAETYAVIGESRQLLEKVKTSLKLDVPVETLISQVSVRPVEGQPMLDIEATAGSPKDAAAIANAVAKELIAIAPAIGAGGEPDPAFAQQDLKDTAEQITQTRDELQSLLAIPDRAPEQQTRLDVLEARLVSLRATYAALLQNATTVAANRVSVIDPAVPPLEASSPRVVLNTVLAAILGVLLAIGVVYLLEHVDDRMKSAEHVETVTGLANLGTILRMPGAADREPFYRLATLLYPRSPAAEAFRTIRTNIEFASIDKPFRTIVVTSAAPGEGKTVTASNLAVAFAQSGRPTILVDGDLRRPGVHDMFSLANAAGLTDLVHSDTIRIDDVLRKTDNPNLSIVTAGMVPPNPAELLGSGRMKVILDRLRDSAEIIVFDTAPVGAVTDAAILAAKSDATLLVVQPYRTTERVVRRGRAALANVNARVIGTVLNNVPHGFTDAVAYYGRYGADGGEAAAPPTPAPAAAPMEAVAESPAPTRASTVVEPTRMTVAKTRTPRAPRTARAKPTETP
ncbi:MAG: polysaccharide biosynthesis tyrosine autokinase [Chloroflexota bacterium]